MLRHGSRAKGSKTLLILGMVNANEREEHVLFSVIGHNNGYLYLDLTP